MKIILTEAENFHWRAVIDGRPDLPTGVAELPNKAVGDLILLNSKFFGLDIERWERQRVPSPAGGTTPDPNSPLHRVY